ncbi:probable methyltransferase-like protein 24 [Haliotis rufescens]|uniref:probable methyltransferase-like protein 24 n=1 Tax=Haliotis rufescens TaxID=6454 RepID=UPI001EAFBF08|nr:probable methyltransferase-like protein 24 [Haliotis rufescens]
MQNSDPNGAKDPLKITEWWQAASLIKWDWEKPVEYKCGEIVKKGNRYVCMDRQFEVKPPCLVYSFGISNDWTFDDAMGNVGCEVHSFDPSIGKKSFDRSKNIHFHDIGLGARDNDTFVPTKDIYVKKATTWKIRRLKTLMEMLGHTHRHLDILKIDVETTEWSAVKDFVESGIFPKVRQLFVEWHLFTTYPSKSNYVEFYTSVKRMQELGMRTFQSKFHTKHYDDKWRLQSDVSYVNVLYKDSV